MSWLRSRFVRSRRLVGIAHPRTLVQSFNYAFEGVIHVLSTQRNMRIHFAAAAIAMIACVTLGVTRLEFAMVILVCAFVIAAEMLNTAVEAAIDVSTTTYNPLAKIAKDVAAGAVLVATFCAVSVGYLVFAYRLREPSASVLSAVRNAPVHVTFVALVLTLLAVISLKVVSGRSGTPLRGGFPSGHAAIAFSAWMAITLVSAGETSATLLSVLTFLMAVLVSQTRVESGIHTWLEVTAGALLGSILTLAIFQIAHFAT